MAKLTKLEKDIAYVSALSDYPNSNDGMTSSQLKETFDKSSNDIKEFINNTLTEEIDLKAEEDANTYATKDELRDLQLGQLIDGTVTIEKLSEDVQERINKVDVVEENLNETKENLETLTKDTNSKLDNIYKYTIPKVEKVMGGNTVETTSTLFGQITDTSTVTNPLVGTCIGNIDGTEYPFEIGLGGTLQLSGSGYETGKIIMCFDYNGFTYTTLNYLNMLLKSKDYNSTNYITIQVTDVYGELLYMKWDLKKIKKATFNYCFSYNSTSGITNYLYGSNDNTTWTLISTLNADGNANAITVQNYRYIKCSFGSTSGNNRAITIYNMYLSDVDDSYYVADNTNFFTLPYSLKNLNKNQRVLIETPSETSIDGVTVNKLNGIEVENILSPSNKYELVYDGEKFVDKADDKVLYDITLANAVNRVDLPGINNMLEEGKIYACSISGTLTGNSGILLGSVYVGALYHDITDTTASTFKLNAPSLAFFNIYRKQNRILFNSICRNGIDGANTSIINNVSDNTDYEYIMCASSTIKFNIGTRIIIKEV